MNILPVRNAISGFQNPRSYNSCLKQYCQYFFILRLCYPTRTTVRCSALQSLPLGPCNCIWSPLSFPFKIGQFTGSVKYCKSWLPDISQLQKRALFQILLQFYIAISCRLSACSSSPVPLLAELAAFPSPRGGISWCYLASKLFTLKHPCRNGKKQRSR